MLLPEDRDVDVNQIIASDKHSKIPQHIFQLMTRRKEGYILKSIWDDITANFDHEWEELNLTNLL